MRKLPINKVKFLFCLLLIIQSVFMCYYGNQKAGYFRDEMYSYGLANSTETIFLNISSDFSEQWHDSEYFQRYIQVEEGQGFNYVSVYNNQVQDVHPPLYYFILHTISSIFPNTFSKWYGISINLVAFIISSIVLYSLTRKIIKNDYIALMPNFMYGFSVAAITSVTFIRMYGILTMFSLIITYIHVKILENNEINKKQMLCLYIFSVLGELTQYYYLIYLFFLAAFYSFYYILKKQWKNLFKYCSSILGGVITLFIIYPASIKHMFVENRGKEAVSNIVNLGNWKEALLSYIKVISTQLFGDKLKLVLLVFLILIIYILIIKAKGGIRVNFSKNICVININRKECKTIEVDLFSIVAITSICVTNILYYIIISKIAPYQTDRYVMLTFPFITFMFVIFTYILLKTIFKVDKKIIGILILVIITLSYFGLRGEYSQYLYPEMIKGQKYIDEYKDSYCIFIYGEGQYGKTYGNDSLNELKEFKEVYMLPAEKIGDIKNILKEKNIDEKVVIYMPKGNTEKETVKCILKNSNFTNSERLYSHLRDAMYLFN